MIGSSAVELMQHWLSPAFAAPPSVDRWRASSRPPGRTWLAAICAALAAHCALLFLAISAPATHLPKMQAPPGFPLLFDQVTSLSAAVIPTENTIATRLTVPKPLKLDNPSQRAGDHPEELARPKSRATTETKPRTYSGAKQSTRRNAAPPISTQPPQSSSGTAGPTAPTPLSSTNDAALLAGLERRIDHAVQEAAIMPEAARRQRRQGRTCLRFSYINGVIDEVALVTSSQSKLLDEAALAALRHANYPTPPAPFWGRRLNLQVWVDFTLLPG